MLSRPFIPAVALALMWPLALSAATPATNPAPPTGAAAWDQLLKHGVAESVVAPSTTQPSKEEYDPSVPIVAPSIAEVVRLSLHNRMLQMTTSLPTSPETMTVKIADFPGRTTAVVNRQFDVPVITVRHEITLLPAAQIIYTLCSLQNDVRLSVDSENELISRSVQYIANTQNDGLDPDNRPVTLYVMVIDKATGARTVDLKLQADDVVQLRRKYPAETAEFLQPMLAALGQETVAFAVDQRTAWQVLHGNQTIDRSIAEQVTKLVAQLDAEDYGTREAASEALEKLGEPAALVVLQLPRAKLSSEQNSRLDAFIAPYKPLSEADAKTYATDVPFLLDCLYTDSKSIRGLAIDQLRKLTARPIAPKMDETPAAWLATVRQLRNELVPTPTTKPTQLQK